MQQNKTAYCFRSLELFVAQTNNSFMSFSRVEKSNWLCLFGNVDNYVHQKVKVNAESYFFLSIFFLEIHRL